MYRPAYSAAEPEWHVARSPVDEPCANWLGAAALRALLAEADLTPKPGLVDGRGGGAHQDMSLALMHRSARALHPGFIAMAEHAARAGLNGRLRAELGVLGRAAEADMLQATDGINTHRGAIWALGLIVASAALRPVNAWRASAILDGVSRLAAIDDPAVPAQPPVLSNGQRAMARFQVAGARQEAINGFRQIPDVGLAQLRASRAAGASEDAARLDALLALMSVLDDTCVLHRRGQTGLALTQQLAARVLSLGGAASRAGQQALMRLDRTLLEHHISPGGSADLLAATLLIDDLEQQAASHSAGMDRSAARFQESFYADAIA